MKIVVDGAPLRTRGSGIPRYTYELLRALHSVGPGHQYYVTDCHAPFLQGRAAPLTDPSGYEAWVQRQVGRTPIYWVYLPEAVRRFVVRQDLKRLGADLYFAPNYLGLFGRAFKTVLTIHDLVYRRFPEVTDPNTLRKLNRHLPYHARQAHAIFADSEATRREVIDLLEVPAEKVHTVHCGVHESFRPVEDRAALEAARRRYALPDRFLLFVGTVEPRKNLVTLLSAFADLAADPGFCHGLVIVGGQGWRDTAIHDALVRHPAAGRIITTGFVPDADLPLIYNLADALAFPSLYEGFGFPALEAMACGTPVVTSKVSSLPEVAGDAAVLVDPHDARDVAAGLRRVLNEPGLREELRRKGLARAREFSWERAARRALELFEQVASQ
jgi:glycosyltransferase involved in cell wall biosynthesis